MPNSEATGNPVFDFRSRFREQAQSIQRIAWSSGALLILVGFVGHFLRLKDAALHLTLNYAPLLGAILILMSLIFGLAWRSKLRRDFQRHFSALRP